MILFLFVQGPIIFPPFFFEQEIVRSIVELFVFPFFLSKKKKKKLLLMEALCYPFTWFQLEKESEEIIKVTSHT